MTPTPPGPIRGRWRPDRSGPDPSREGDVLPGGWRLVEYLGSGVEGDVYASTDGRREVAVKVMRRSFSDDASRAQFARQEHIIADLTHPGLAQYFGDGETEDGFPFVVLERLRGESVDSRLRGEGRPFDVLEVLQMAEGIVDVLAYLHDASIVHLDVSPQNIFFTEDARVKLLDFGLARVAGRPFSGEQIGDLYFMSPEQAREDWQAVDGRSDLFMLGATLRTLLLGEVSPERRRQADEPDDRAAFLRAATLPIPSIALEWPDLPQPLITLVDRAIAFAQADRWPSARVMHQEVVALLADD